MPWIILKHTLKRSLDLRLFSDIHKTMLTCFLGSSSKKCVNIVFKYVIYYCLPKYDFYNEVFKQKFKFLWKYTLFMGWPIIFSCQRISKSWLLSYESWDKIGISFFRAALIGVVTTVAMQIRECSRFGLGHIR